MREGEGGEGEGEGEQGKNEQKIHKIVHILLIEKWKTPLKSAFWRPEHLRTIQILARDKKSNCVAKVGIGKAYDVHAVKWISKLRFFTKTALFVCDLVQIRAISWQSNRSGRRLKCASSKNEDLRYSEYLILFEGQNYTRSILLTLEFSKKCAIKWNSMYVRSARHDTQRAGRFMCVEKWYFCTQSFMPFT